MVSYGHPSNANPFDRMNSGGLGMTTPQHETMNSGPVLGKMDEDGIFSAGDTQSPHVQHRVSCVVW